MTEVDECPICMDVIGDKNCITTECGHKFHATCMFKNVGHNGFKCPCCRSQMIEDIDDDENDEDYEEESQDEESVYEVEFEGPFSDDSLRGLRLLTNLLEGEEPDQEDVISEYQYVNVESEHYISVIPRQMIEQKLREQGVTYEQLFTWILIDHHEFESQTKELEEFSGNIWEKINKLIVDYRIEEVDRNIESLSNQLLE